MHLLNLADVPLSRFLPPELAWKLFVCELIDHIFRYLLIDTVAELFLDLVNLVIVECCLTLTLLLDLGIVNNFATFDIT